MTRTITAATTTESQAELCRPVYFVKLEYDAGTVYANNSDRDIVFSGDTYLGVGYLGNVSAVEETTELQNQDVELVLNGIDSNNISQALGQSYQGRPATIWLGFLDSNYALVADPCMIFRGVMDSQNIMIGEQAVITLNLRNELADWRRPRVRRYNNSDHTTRRPNDKFFEFVEQTATLDL